MLYGFGLFVWLACISIWEDCSYAYFRCSNLMSQTTGWYCYKLADSFTWCDLAIQNGNRSFNTPLRRIRSSEPRSSFRVKTCHWLFYFPVACSIWSRKTFFNSSTFSLEILVNSTIIRKSETSASYQGFVLNLVFKLKCSQLTNQQITAD